MNVQRSELKLVCGSCKDLSHCEEELLNSYFMEWTSLSAETREPSVRVSVGAHTEGFERFQAIDESSE